MKQQPSQPLPYFIHMSTPAHRRMDRASVTMGAICTVMVTACAERGWHAPSGLMHRPAPCAAACCASLVALRGTPRLRLRGGECPEPGGWTKPTAFDDSKSLSSCPLLCLLPFLLPFAAQCSALLSKNEPGCIVNVCCRPRRACHISALPELHQRICYCTMHLPSPCQSEEWVRAPTSLLYSI